MENKLVPIVNQSCGDSGRSSARAAANGSRKDHTARNGAQVRRVNYGGRSSGGGSGPNSNGREKVAAANAAQVTSEDASSGADHAHNSGPNGNGKSPCQGLSTFQSRPNSKKGLRYDKFALDYDANVAVTHAGFNNRRLYNREMRTQHNHRMDANGTGRARYQQKVPYIMKGNSNTPVFNKEQYLQANGQFVVLTENGNVNKFAANLINPDLPVAWEKIQLIRQQHSESPNCPICLYPPIAAKMTRCGHVFCWACLLHYLALTDKQWRKCPICFESVHGDQLKSFESLPVTKLEVGAELSMSLMCRRRGSLLVAPCNVLQEHTAVDGDDQHVLYTDVSRALFGKLLMAEQAQIVQSVIMRERHELQWKWAQDRDEPEACFLVQAMKELDEREAQLTAPGAKPHSASNSPKHRASSHKEIQPKLTPQTNAPIYLDAFNDVKLGLEMQEMGAAVEAIALDEVPETAAVDVEDGDELEEDRAEANTQTHCYYFYQASDGQQVYLHPLNARSLIHEYGLLNNAPHQINGRVEHCEQLLMTDAVRKRFRYMSHIPLGTCFTLVEMCFAEGVLGHHTINHFKAEFSKREQARKRRAASETRRQHRGERLDKALLMDPANYPRYVQRVDELTDDDFPRFVASAQHELSATWIRDANGTATAAGNGYAVSVATDSNRTRLTSLGSTASAPSPNLNQEYFPTLGQSQDEMSQPLAVNEKEPLVEVPLPSPPSFAQMLRQGKPKSGSVASNQSQVELAHSQQSTDSAQHRVRTLTDGELDNGLQLDLPAPSYASAWGDALDSALIKARDHAANEESGTKKIKKGKKKKQVLLFST